MCCLIAKYLYNRLIKVPHVHQYEMINGFSFYEFNGKDYAVVAINSWNLALKSESYYY